MSAPATPPAVACLAEDELERGCLVLDMGGGTTGLAHFAGGRLTLVDQVPYGGDHITGDLAYGLSTSRQHAERIKNLFGGTQFRSCDDGTRIEHPLPRRPCRPADRRGAAHPHHRNRARPRRGDSARWRSDRLDEHGELLASRPPRSIVLTGGGSQLEGIEELVQEMFRLPARCGRPGRSADAGRAARTSHAAPRRPVRSALVLGDDGGLGWRDQVEVSMLSHRLARLGQWFRENF